MGQRGPLPNPHSGRTARGLNGLAETIPIRDPGDWEPVEASKPFDDILGDYGRELWHDVAPRLKDAGIMTRLDVAVFALLCSCWNEYRTACDELKKTGTTYDTGRGRTELHPLCKVRDSAGKLFLNLVGMFGMTPASRKRHNWTIKNHRDDEQSPFAKWLKQRG